MAGATVRVVVVSDDRYRELCQVFGGRIRAERRGLAMDQMRFAAFVGVLSSNTVSRWESGGFMPRARALIALADRLGCTLDFLLGLTEDRRGLRPGATAPLQEPA